MNISSKTSRILFSIGILSVSTSVKTSIEKNKEELEKNDLVFIEKETKCLIQVSFKIEFPFS